MTEAEYAIPGTAIELFGVVVVSAVSVAVTALPPLACDSDRELAPTASGLLKDGGLTRTSRIRLFPVSAMKRLPAESTAIPLGLFNDPAVRQPAVAGVTGGSITHYCADEAVRRDLPDAVMLPESASINIAPRRPSRHPMDR